MNKFEHDDDITSIPLSLPHWIQHTNIRDENHDFGKTGKSLIKQAKPAMSTKSGKSLMNAFLRARTTFGFEYLISFRAEHSDADRLKESEDFFSEID